MQKDFCNTIGKERTQGSPATLGDVLYARSKALVPEQDWAALVQSIAAGDQLSLHVLYERAHRPVFNLMMRITCAPSGAVVILTSTPGPSCQVHYLCVPKS